MTATIHEEVTSPARMSRPDRDAALKMLRADALTYVAALFDWLDEGENGAEYAATYACFDATEKRFHEVLTWIIQEAQEKDALYGRLCTERAECKCICCRYPAEDPDEDERPAWTRLMGNVRARSAR